MINNFKVEKKLGLRFYTGLEIAGLLASLAGTGLGVAGSMESQSAMNDAAKAELSRQQQFNKQGQSVLQQSIAQSTPKAAQQQLGQGQQQALQEYAKVQSTPASYAQGAQSDLAKATSDTTVQGKNQLGNQAAAPLQSYDAYSLAQQIKDMQAQTQLGQIGTFARQSESVLPLEMQQAGQSGSTLSGIGSILNTLGGLTSLYGATRPQTVVGANQPINFGGSSYGVSGAQPMWMGLAAPQRGTPLNYFNFLGGGFN